MSVIARLTHPQHGNKDAHTISELEDDKRNGWVVVDADAPATPTLPDFFKLDDGGESTTLAEDIKALKAELSELTKKVTAEQKKLDGLKGQVTAEQTKLEALKKLPAAPAQTGGTAVNLANLNPNA